MVGIKLVISDGEVTGMTIKKWSYYSGPISEGGTRIGSYCGIIYGIEEIEYSTLVDFLVSESGYEIGYSYDMLCINEVVKLERYSLVLY